MMEFKPYRLSEISVLSLDDELRTLAVDGGGESYLVSVKDPFVDALEVLARKVHGYGKTDVVSVDVALFDRDGSAIVAEKRSGELVAIGLE